MITTTFKYVISIINLCLKNYEYFEIRLSKLDSDIDDYKEYLTPK